MQQRSYRGVSAEQRRAERRARLLAAALDLVGTVGLAATTMTEVCARARLTERYFYESFRSLDELVAELMTEQAERLQEHVLAAVARVPQDDPRGTLRAAVLAFFELTDGDPRLSRVVLAESMGSPALRVRRHQLVHRFADLVTEHAQRRYGAALSPAAAKLGGVLLVGGLGEVVMARQSGELDTPATAVAAALVDQFDALADR